jgi:hypothetical protein
MPSDTLNTKVHQGMRIISTDGVAIGTVRRVHFRDTEACIEIRPHSFWNALLDAFTLREEQTNSSHLFVPARTIAKVDGKRVHVQLDAEAVRACVNRPPWIEREQMPPTGFNSGRMP